MNTELHILIDWTNYFANIKNYLPQNLKIISKENIDKLKDKKKI